jgi:hypothetical protein
MTKTLQEIFALPWAAPFRAGTSLTPAFQHVAAKEFCRFSPVLRLLDIGDNYSGARTHIAHDPALTDGIERIHDHTTDRPW